MHPIHLFIYWSSFLLFPILFWSVYKSYKFRKITYILFSLFILLGIYSRFIETQMIQVNTTRIDLENLDKPIQIALVADLQVGVYKGNFFTKRLFKKIEALDPDYILYAGDITYKPNQKNLSKLMAPFTSEVSSYAVLGNHDYLHTGVPSDSLSEQITQELESIDVPVIDNEIVNTKDFTLVGYGSIWANNFELIENTIANNVPLIRLMHNPDGVDKLATEGDLTLAGHTHCGQIRIPFTYKYTLPTDRVFKPGLQDSPSGPLYVSCGLGESALPLRLFNPPTIDLLIIY